jgi:hypothetical protein
VEPGTGAAGQRFPLMQLSQPDQAAKMRNLAAELRDHAAHTALRDYQDKFERTARDLEMMAGRLEQRSRFHLAS